MFREIDKAQVAHRAARSTRRAAALKAVRSAALEDIDYRKGGTGREMYFTVTGQTKTGVNADYSRTKYGRVYRLTLDAADPLKGTLEVLLDGDDRSGPARSSRTPTTSIVGTNYVYVQEDDNGYGDETHDAYVYQYNIATKELKPGAQLDHRRTATDAAKYNAAARDRRQGRLGVRRDDRRVGPAGHRARSSCSRCSRTRGPGRD